MRKLIYNSLSNKIFGDHNPADIIIATTTSSELPYEIEVIAENLYVPWAIDISDEGKLYFTERSGSVRVFENSKLTPRPLITFRAPFESQGEGGLLGIVLDPDYSQNQYMKKARSKKEFLKSTF